LWNVTFKLKRENLPLLVLVICLTPLYWINKSGNVDWGDDNFQYLTQSKYVWTRSAPKVLNYEDYAPSNRGKFFSLVLSSFKRDNITAYKNATSVIYILSCVFFFFFLRKRLRVFESTIVTLLFAYNFICVRLKDEILSEFLFIALIFLGHNLAQSNRRLLKLYASAFVFACAFLTRSAAVVFYIPVLINAIFTSEKYKPDRRFFVLGHLTLTIAFVAILNSILFPSQKDLPLFYTLSISQDFSFAKFAENTILYRYYLFRYFDIEAPQAIVFVYKSFVCLLVFVGALRMLARKAYDLPICVLLYFLLLLVYPNQTNAFRLLSPIIPFLLMIFFEGIIWVTKKVNLKSTFSAYVAFLFLSFAIWTTLVNNSGSSEISTGPYDKSFQEDFSYIRSHTPKSSVIAFNKPFVINYFCERDSYALTSKNCSEKLIDAFYVLIPKWTNLKELQLADWCKQHPGKKTELNYFYLLAPNL
jgi:hypothetical protein